MKNLEYSSQMGLIKAQCNNMLCWVLVSLVPDLHIKPLSTQKHSYNGSQVKVRLSAFLYHASRDYA